MAFEFVDKLSAFLKTKADGCTAFLKEECRRKKVSFEPLSLTASYILLVGVLDWLLQRYFFYQATAMHMQWTIGFRTEGPAYNAAFISYVLAIVGITGGVIAGQVLNYMPAFKKFLISINEKIWRKILCLAVLVTFITPFQLAFVCSLVAVLLFGLRLVVGGFPSYDGPAKPLFRGILYITLLGLIVFSLSMGFKAWYPLTLSNDYIEAVDNIGVPAQDGYQKSYLDRLSAINCLIAEKIVLPVKPRDASKEPNTVLSFQQNKSAETKPCPHPLTQVQADLMEEPIKYTGKWQSQAGRTLYHHSYLFVPIAHLQKYGLSASIPYLYGLGNTYFYSLLLAGKPITLTNYFEIYPLAQLIGILVLVLCILFIVRNRWVVPSAFAAVLIPLYQIGFENILVPPGFNPLRYTGIVIQLASIFYVYRNPSVFRVLVMIGTLAFSVVWNKEFAMLGLMGQLLALIAPQLKIGSVARVTSIAACLAITFALIKILSGLSEGFLETIQSGMFSIAVPRLRNYDFLLMCLAVFTAVCLMLYSALRFEEKERVPRLCIIPVLCLVMIKFLYYPMYAHLLFAMVFIFPVSLIYFDWNNQTHGWMAHTLTLAQRKRITFYMLTILVLVCLTTAGQYHRDSLEYRNKQVSMFQKNSWTGLGETIQTVTPAMPIETRMKAIQNEMKPEDTLLFLSPFDHLMSFYANPKSYCGHFENLTNFVTYQNLDQVVGCVKSTPNMLMVYDDAVDNKCPTDLVGNYYHMPSCIAKKKLLTSMRAILEKVQSNLVLVKKVGPLSFYRHAKTESANIPFKSKKSFQ